MLKDKIRLVMMKRLASIQNSSHLRRGKGVFISSSSASTTSITAMKNFRNHGGLSVRGQLCFGHSTLTSSTLVSSFTNDTCKKMSCTHGRASSSFTSCNNNNNNNNQNNVSSSTLGNQGFLEPASTKSTAATVALHDLLIGKIQKNIQLQSPDGFQNALSHLHTLLETFCIYTERRELHRHDTIITNTYDQSQTFPKNVKENTIQLFQCIHSILMLGKELASENDQQNEKITFQDCSSIALDILHHMDDLLHDEQFCRHIIAMDGTIIVQRHWNDDLNPIAIYNLVAEIVSKSKKPVSILENIIHQMKGRSSSSTSVLHDYWNIQPNVYTYNSLLYAYSLRKYNGAAADCESQLRQIINQHSKQFISQQRQINKKKTSNVIVDTASYNIVLKAWSKSNDKNALERSERLLEEMQKLYSRGNTHVKPNYITFTTLFDIISNSNDFHAAKKVTSLLRSMEDMYDQEGDNVDSGNDDILKPNLYTYNAVLNVWAKSRLPGAAQHAQDMLNELITNSLQQYNDELKIQDYSGPITRIHIVEPNTASFTTCIKAHANSDEKGSSAKALGLLKQMMHLHTNHGWNTKPDLGTFNSVIRTLANDSMNEDKAIKAECLLRQMEETNIIPDLITYNNCLRCCCNTKSPNNEKIQRSAIRIASQVLLQIKHRTSSPNHQSSSSLIKPNPYTFNFFIKTCDRLSSGKEKLKLIKAAFHFCINQGQFSKPVLSIMKNALKPNELREILQLDAHENLQSLKVSHFPIEWRNQVR